MLLVVVLSEVLTRASGLVGHGTTSGTSKRRQRTKKSTTVDKYIMLNLTEEVEKYIVNYIGEGLVDYSLKGKKVADQSPTVTASAGKLTYGDGCNKLSYIPGCNNVYIFYMNHGISTPFNISINITLPFRDLRNDTLPADINGAGYVYWNPDNINMSLRYTRNYTEGICNFSVEVTFTGLFAYEVTTVRGDKPKKGVCGIGKVAYINPLLDQYDDNVLKYNVTGVLAQTRTSRQ
uniref:Putative da-p36 protein n=1 Tax=Rhipicephalus pulchellus TaxID=72859 RepID=L7LQ62_RHIPC